MRSGVWLALLFAACGPAAGTRPPVAYPGELSASDTLEAPSALGDAFMLDQRVRSESEAGNYEFRAVLQLHEGVLTLVGLGPHGGRGFVLTLRGDEVEFESHLPEELPFAPEFMLHDIQRAWFRGLQHEPSPPPDGEHTDTIGDERVTERWRDGRLRERTFERVDGEPAGVLRVIYEGGLGTDEPPPTVTLDNAWFGYRLILTTLTHRRL